MADGIFEQLRRESEPPASVRIAGFSSHNLTAVVREFFRGQMSGAEATAALGLTPQSVIELQAVAAEITAGNLSEAEVSDLFDLIQARVFYIDKAQVITRLGL
jgi:hypothetical protein